MAPATGWQQPEGRGDHGQHREAHAHQHALHGDAARPPGDADGLSQPVQPIDRDDHVGRLRRRRGASCAHGHADVGSRQRRRVVDAVADHGHAAGSPDSLGVDGLDLLGRGTLGQHAVHAQRRGDRLGDRRMVAGDHHDAPDACLPQQPQRPWGLGADGVLEHDDARELAADLHEDGAGALHHDLLTDRAGPLGK